MSGALRRVGLSLVAFALAGGYALYGAGEAHADPATVDQARAQLDQLQQQQSDIAAQYTEVQVKLQDSQKALDDARTDVASQQAKVAALKSQVSQLALQQYRSSGIDTTTQLLVTDDVQSFLNGLSTMKKASDNTASLLQDYQSAQADLADLQKSTAAETAQISAQEASLADLKKQADDKVAAAQALLDKLTAAQRQQLAAAQAAANQQAAAKDTSRSATRTPAPAITVGSGGSARAMTAMNFALSQVGKAYMMGGTGPNAYDCSGLTMVSYAHAGVALPRTSQAQYGVGQPVGLSELAPGDLVFYYSGISHVGIYIGNGMIVHAANPSSGVTTASVTSMPFMGGRRVA
ncbi:MAG TPA: NlpC/P60 family protein [Propionibacteriaceae bacterium]|nr:NlpC/P60 family protein [Propionibacteriaceae bacterium]